MTPHDKNNLDFLMHSSPDALALWWDQTDKTDREYAFTLLELARLDLVDRAIDIHDLKESRKLLKRYTIKPRKK